MKTALNRNALSNSPTAHAYALSFFFGLLFLVVGTIPFATAQPRPDGPHHGPPSPERMEADMTSEMESILQALALPEHKHLLVLPLLEKDIQQRISLLQQGAPPESHEDRHNLHQAMQAITQKTNDALMMILSGEEMEYYHRLRKERRSQRPRPPKSDNQVQSQRNGMNTGSKHDLNNSPVNPGMSHP